jgi:hypothetical protein
VKLASALSGGSRFPAGSFCTIESLSLFGSSARRTSSTYFTQLNLEEVLRCLSNPVCSRCWQCS